MNSREIILACRHAAQPCDVNLGDGGRARCCCECWNASVAARRIEDKARNAAAAERGREYWHGRGIALGETVRAWGQSLYGRYPVTGTAKVGRCGAYVVTRACRGQLDPGRWEKIEA